MSCYVVACRVLLCTGCSRVAAVVGQHLGQRQVRLLRVWWRRHEQGAHRAADKEHQRCAPRDAHLPPHGPPACFPTHTCVPTCVCRCVFACACACACASVPLCLCVPLCCPVCMCAVTCRPSRRLVRIHSCTLGIMHAWSYRGTTHQLHATAHSNFTNLRQYRSWYSAVKLCTCTVPSSARRKCIQGWIVSQNTLHPYAATLVLSTRVQNGTACRRRRR